MSEYKYAIKRLPTKSWIKWWIDKEKAGVRYILSELLFGTDFTLENCTTRAFKIFELFGNSVQNTTKGKNKLDPNKFNGKTANGMTASLNEDGSIRFNGTTTAVTNFWFPSGLGLILPADKYYFITNVGLQNKGRYAISDMQGNAVYGGASSGDFTLLEETELNFILIQINANVTFNNEDFYLAISTDNEYEPYTGGEVSPNPNYPQEIKSCGDNIQLFDKTAITSNTSIASGTGNTYNDNNSFSTDYINIKGYKNICWNGASDSNNNTWGALYDDNKNYLNGFSTKNNTISIDNNVAYVRMGILNSYLDTLKVEKGNKATPWSPYGMGCITETITNDDYSGNFVNGYVDNDGSIVSSSGWLTTQEYIEVTSETEYFIKAVSSSTRCLIGEYDENKTFIPNRREIVLGNSITTRNNTKYIKFSVLAGATDIRIFHIINEYIVYTNKPLRAVGNVRDRFEKVNGVWYERHFISYIESYNGETLTTDYMSTTGQLSTGASIQYVATVPTDLLCTGEQNTALDELEKARTYKNITHISSTDEVKPNIKLQYWEVKRI